MIQVIDVVVDVGGRNEIFIGNSNSRYGPLTLFSAILKGFPALPPPE